MFLIVKDGCALIIAKRISCFKASLALKLVYLIYSKDIFIIAKTSFCAMANLVNRTLSGVLTLIFRLLETLPSLVFYFLDQGKL